MAAYRCEAIVLRAQPFGEADRLATLLSPELGKIRAVARGASRGRSALTAIVQPFVHGRFLLWHGRELDGISQAEPLQMHTPLSRDVGLLAAASYGCDLCAAVTVERQEAEGVFARLLGALGALAAPPPAAAAAVILRWLELGCLAASGFGPELSCCTVCGRPIGEPAGRTRVSADGGGVLCPACPGAGPGLTPSALRGLRYLAGADAAALPRVRVGPATMAEMDGALSRHIGAVLQRPLRSRALLDILTSG